MWPLRAAWSVQTPLLAAASRCGTGWLLVWRICCLRKLGPGLPMGRIHSGTPGTLQGFGLWGMHQLSGVWFWGWCSYGPGSGAKALLLGGTGTVMEATFKLLSTYVRMSKPCCSSWSCMLLSYRKLSLATPGKRGSSRVKLPTSYMGYAFLEFGFIRGP